MKTTAKYAFVFLIVACYSFSGLYAQTFEEYKKRREQELQAFKDDRAKQLKQLAGEFDEYVKKQDQEYAKYLKERWQQFQVFRGLEVPEEPKPDVAPVFEETQQPMPPVAIPALKPAIEESPVSPEPILPRVTRKEPENFPTNQGNFDYYGFPALINYDKDIADIRLRGKVNEEAIGEIFNRFSSTNYNGLLEQFFDYSKMMNLNDWGYYMLIKDASKSFAGYDENTQKLFTWFMLIRSGYRAKIAYFENEVFILIPIKNQVYGVNFFPLGGINYYLMDGNLTNIFTYEKDFPEAQKSFDLNLYKATALGEGSLNKAIEFEYLGKEYLIPVQYNKNVIDFYKDYPLADIKVYFDAVVSSEAKASLATAFYPLIYSKSEVDAVNLLLHFVQTGFDYETDQEQFGYEKFFFAEELFYYPYCDCEDRSVLFSYLVKSLLGLDVIGLNYPGHVATAVHFNSEVGGDFVEFDGRKYVISDPTYINAPVGLAMPEYKTTQAEIIVPVNNYFEGRKKDFLWDDVIAAGGNRGDNGRDLIMNEDGSGILTGYFTHSFTYGNIDEAGNDQPSMFVMNVDSEKNPVWFSNSKGDGMAMAYNILSDKEKNTYVTGTFDGEMIVSGEKIETKGENADIFLAKYSRTGALDWIRKANIDTANKTNEFGVSALNFVSRFSPAGNHLANELFFETGDFNNYGISISPEGEIIVAGAFNKTTGMNVMEISKNAGGEFNTITSLKVENDKFLQEDYEKTIAGLFAVIKLVQNSGMIIQGTETQQVLDEYNPAFKTEFPEIYKTIEKIHFVKNQDGIVTVKTADDKALSIALMRVNTNAKIKIFMLENGDARLEVISGIKVGKALWWYDLNYVLMYKENGDMLFDYDTDHAQAVKNLRVDILY